MIECVPYREQILIVLGVIVMIISNLIHAYERRIWRRSVSKYLATNVNNDIHAIDRS